MRQTLSLEIARALTVVGTHIQTVGRHRISTDAAEAEVDKYTS